MNTSAPFHCIIKSSVRLTGLTAHAHRSAVKTASVGPSTSTDGGVAGKQTSVVLTALTPNPGLQGSTDGPKAKGFIGPMGVTSYVFMSVRYLLPSPPPDTDLNSDIALNVTQIYVV